MRRICYWYDLPCPRCNSARDELTPAPNYSLLIPLPTLADSEWIADIDAT
jgi:hypothetical protein